MELGRIMRCSLDGNKEQQKKSVKNHFNKCELFYNYISRFVYIFTRIRSK